MYERNNEFSFKNFPKEYYPNLCEEKAEEYINFLLISNIIFLEKLKKKSRTEKYFIPLFRHVYFHLFLYYALHGMIYLNMLN